MIRRPPRSTLFPYTPLSRSRRQMRAPEVPPRHFRHADTELGHEDEVDAQREHRSAGHAGDAPALADQGADDDQGGEQDRKSTRLNSSHLVISYAVFCLKKKK